MGCRGSTEGGRGCAPSGAVQVGGSAVRIVNAGAYLPKIWLPQAPRGQHLKDLTEPDLHGSWLACHQGDRSFAKWTAIFGHCGRSFIFLASFAKNDEVAARDLKSSETRNVFDVGYFRVFNPP